MRPDLLRYILVGAFVGISASLLLWMTDKVVGHSPLLYAVLIAVIYFLGIICSYKLHRHFTFTISTSNEEFSSLSKFATAAVISGLACTAVATAIKFFAEWPSYLNEHAGWMSFVLANMPVAYATYLVNRTWVFKYKKL